MISAFSGVRYNSSTSVSSTVAMVSPPDYPGNSKSLRCGNPISHHSCHTARHSSREDLAELFECLAGAELLFAEPRHGPGGDCLGLILRIIRNQHDGNG